MGKGSWNQIYIDSIRDKQENINKLKESLEPFSLFKYLFNKEFRQKRKEINNRIEILLKSIKSDELEMY